MTSAQQLNAMAESKQGSDCLLQGALLVSCSPSNSVSSLIKTICETDDAPQPLERLFDDHRVLCYPWDISTKYYDARIHLYELPCRSLISSEFCKCVQAAIVYFSNDSKSCFDEVQLWLSYIREFHPEVKMLMCNKATDETAVSREALLQWCISNEFELVELYPEELDDESGESDDFFKETTGAKRVMQALSAHMWPSMKLKGSHVYKPSAKFAEAIAREGNPSGDAAEVECCGPNRSDDAADEDSFESLFSSFGDMKRTASKLSGEERKAYAEQITVAFWKALGGDGEEISGLDSD